MTGISAVASDGSGRSAHRARPTAAEMPTGGVRDGEVEPQVSLPRRTEGKRDIPERTEVRSASRGRIPHRCVTPRRCRVIRRVAMVPWEAGRDPESGEFRTDTGSAGTARHS